MRLHGAVINDRTARGGAAPLAVLLASSRERRVKTWVITCSCKSSQNSSSSGAFAPEINARTEQSCPP